MQKSIQENIFLEKLSLLYKNLIVSVPASFICSTLVLISLYRKADHRLLISWYITVIVVSCLRLLSVYFYHRFKKHKAQLSFFIFGTIASAALWGFAGSFLMSQGNALHQMVVIIIIAGVTAGGVQTLQANLVSAITYVTTAITPLIIYFFLQ